MKVIHQGLLVLIRSALTEEKLPLPEGFSLEAAEELIRSQTMEAMAYRGAFNCGIAPMSEIMQHYQVLYFQQLVHSEKQMQAINRVFRAFEQAGIDYMPLKGTNLKALYPRPELRIMSDADVLIRLEQYGQIQTIMGQLGFEAGIESHHDYSWSSPALYLELHKRLFAPNQPDLYGYFGEGWDKAHPEAGCRYAMSHEDEYIYIFTHMTKHFRALGIGARQVIDLYIYRLAHPDMDEARIEQVLDQLNLLEFYRNIRQTLAVWFEDAPADPVTELITDYVFSSGNFGTLENKMYTQELLKSRKKRGGKNSRLASLMSTLFPPLYRMQLAYNTLYKYPVLLPVFWPIRWVDTLLRRRDKVSKKLQIIKGMTGEKLQAHEDALHLMGLSLDFADED